jgi:hypothetical protein
MSIAATRMHRSLVDFASGHADMYEILYSVAFFGSLFAIYFGRTRESTKRQSSGSTYSRDQP